MGTSSDALTASGASHTFLKLRQPRKVMTVTNRQSKILAAIGAATVLMVAACSEGDTSEADEGPAGDPVSGGVGRIIQTNEPRSLDPATLGNSWASAALLGNALYGTLFVNDPETDELEFKIAESFESEDGGETFTLVIREGVEFSDGSPLTAEAVAYNWDRIKDPATGSPDIPQAVLIESTEVIDDQTLEVSLTEAVPNFAHAILTTSLNWVGEPESLEGTQEQIDSNPIGAGPYTLVNWARQDVIRLERNDSYWDDPKPYLDELEVRSIPDRDQRVNTVSSGGADVAVESSWQGLDRAESEGLQQQVVPLGGGSAMMLNNQREPFDDPRARRALAYAIEHDELNAAAYEGTARLATTLFEDDSPFYSDISLQEHDPELAQELFDELAAEGNPVSFAFSAFPGDARIFGEALQAQLSAFDNVDMSIEPIDVAEAGVITAQGDFQAITSTATFTDPEPRLWFAFHSTSQGNYSGVSDPELDEALDLGRQSEDEQERAAAYETVQEKLVEIMPVVFSIRTSVGIIANDDVGGVQPYGLGSLLPEELWLEP